MAHEITTADAFGRAALTAPAWHGLGVELPADVRTAVAAGDRLGILWQTRLAPMQAILGGDPPAFAPVESGEQAQIRCDTGQVLGVVGKVYQTIQNRELAELADVVGLPIETAGTLSGGLRAFFCLRGEPFDAAPGDTQERYVLACNAHAGVGSAGLFPTAVRVVCRNTYRAAENDLGRGMLIRHTGDVQTKLAQVRHATAAAAAWHATYRDQARAMAVRTIDDAARIDLFRSIYVETFGDPQQTQDAELKAAKIERMNDVVLAWRNLLDAATNSLPSIRGTVWQALQCVTEWHDHVRGRVGSETKNAEKWNTARLFGSGAVGKATAFKLALAAV
jgi:phage/plasmid-like protein (TIGR03299 family)